LEPRRKKKKKNSNFWATTREKTGMLSWQINSRRCDRTRTGLRKTRSVTEWQKRENVKR